MVDTPQIPSRDFYLKEFESRRKEIMETLKDYHALERNTVIAVGATWAWLFHEGSEVKTTPAHVPPHWAWFIPVIFVALGAARAAGIMKSFGVFHDYIEKLETHLSQVGDPGGWEHFSWNKTWSGPSSWAFWAIIILASVIMGIYQTLPY